MSQITLAVDVDGVCADLHAEWLRRYNAEFGDTLTYDRIRAWDMVLAVKPECGKQIYKYLRDPDLYENVPVITGAHETITDLRDHGARIIFVTSCVRGMADQKWEWLEKHDFLPAGAHSQNDLVIAHDKSLIRADALLDDYDGNLTGWMRRGILLDAPYNRHAIGSWTRVRSWSDVPNAIAGLRGLGLIA
jgi:5'-nucleotidase